MKKSGIVILAGVLACLSAGAAYAQYGFAQGRFSGFGQLDWESSCSKPNFRSAEDADEYQVRSTTSDYQQYVSCLSDQASSDARYASNAVIEKAEEELEEVKDDARSRGWNLR